MAGSNSVRILDSDGHIIEDVRSIMDRMPANLLQGNAVRSSGPFPATDHLHFAAHSYPEGAFKDPGGAAGWGTFLDESGIGGTVVYPTRALTYGKILDPDIAIAAARAYNDWLYDDYFSLDPRINAAALIPMQDTEAAVIELRHAVEDLGMAGAMLPGTGLHSPLGNRRFWPVYEEANRLGSVLAVHAGAHHDMGLNAMTPFAGVHALGHPFAISIAFVDMLFNGVFDRFPNARFAFLEGGLAWFLMAMERCEGAFAAFHPVDPQNRFLSLADGETVADYVQRHMDEGRLFVGIEGDEPMLADAIAKYGSKAFVFSSDFPHEVNIDTIREEIQELLGNDRISDDAKDDMLYGNALRLYGNAWSRAAVVGS